MRSKTSFFNFALFRNNIVRMWPVWAVYLAGLIMMFPARMITESYYFTQASAAIASDLMHSAAYAGLPMVAACYAVISAMALYNYLYTTKSAGMIGSFPITRRALFFTNYMSGVAWTVGSNLITAILIVIVEIILDKLMLGYVVQWFLIYSLQCVFFFSFATFCAALTGNIIMLPAIYGLFNFIFIIFELIFTAVSHELLIGLAGSSYDYRTIPLTPFIKLEEARIITLGTELNPSFQYDSWEWLVGYFVVGLVLVAIAIYLIRYRHMETATDVIAVKWLRPVFKFGAAIGCGSVLGLFTYAVFFEGEFTGDGAAIPLGICMVIFAVIGCYAAEMMLQKSLKVFSNLRDPIIAACAMALIVCAVSMDFFGVENYIPDEDDVTYVTLSVHGESSVFRSEDAIEDVMEMHRLMLRHKEELKGRYYYPDFKTAHVRIGYRNDNNGLLSARTYDIPLFEERNDDEKTYQGKLQALVNSEEAIRSRTSVHQLVEHGEYHYNDISWRDENDEWRNRKLEQEEIKYLLEQCILPDIEDGNLGQLDLMDLNNVKSRYTGITVYVESTLSDREYLSTHLDIKTTAQRTLAFLDSLGIKTTIVDDNGDKIDYLYNDKLIDGVIRDYAAATE